MALLHWGALTQTHEFFICGSFIGGESISSRASAVINQTAVLFTMPVGLATSSQKTHCDGFLYSSGQPVQDDHRLTAAIPPGAGRRSSSAPEVWRCALLPGAGIDQTRRLGLVDRCSRVIRLRRHCRAQSENARTVTAGVTVGILDHRGATRLGEDLRFSSFV